MFFCCVKVKLKNDPVRFLVYHAKCYRNMLQQTSLIHKHGAVDRSIIFWFSDQAPATKERKARCSQKLPVEMTTV